MGVRTSINYGDLVMWTVIAYFFHWGMSLSFRRYADESVRLIADRWYLLAPKTFFTVFPLWFAYVFADFEVSFMWNAICVVALAMITAPLAFPRMNVMLRKKSFGERISDWIIGRLDRLAKIAAIAAVCWPVFYFFPALRLHQIIPIPHYFVPKGADLQWPFNNTFVVIAVFGVVLRAMVMIGFSKVHFVMMGTLSLMLIGYAVELGAAIHSAKGPYSGVLVATVLIDLATHLYRKIDD